MKQNGDLCIESEAEEGAYGRRPKKRREIILEVVENQIRDNNPPETRQPLSRLIKEGFSRGKPWN